LGYLLIYLGFSKRITVSVLPFTLNEPFIREPAIHETVEIDPEVRIGKGTRIWHQTQIRTGANIGENCVIGKGVYIDFNVTIGNNVKIQNRTTLYNRIIIENNVNIGPHVCFNSEQRIILPQSQLNAAPTKIRYKAQIGAGSVIMPGVQIGAYAIIEPGSVITCDVPHHAYVRGNPAVLAGYVCVCGCMLNYIPEMSHWVCPGCEELFTL
jgi:UDP-3-O-[3-hydroxymyristoyl] glucosamine N-acyltransferase